MPLLALAALLLGTAHAQVLYKWIDAQGKVQYSDQPPKGFKGEVTRIEPDPPPTFSTQPRPAAPAAKPEAKPAKAEDRAAPDLAARRKERREKLAADVTRAREKLEAAKKALDGDEGPGVDERQVVRQTYRKGTQPATSRSNCREMTGADGKKTLMCPALEPSSSYYERVQQLEEAVKRAEEELELAERAYRRGVD